MLKNSVSKTCLCWELWAHKQDVEAFSSPVTHLVLGVLLVPQVTSVWGGRTHNLLSIDRFCDFLGILFGKPGGVGRCVSLGGILDGGFHEFANLYRSAAISRLCLQRGMEDLSLWLHCSPQLATAFIWQC